MATALLGLRRLSRSLGRVLAVTIAIVAVSQPRAFVWCQTESGHAALEALEAGCCGVPGPEARCSPDLARTEPRGAAEEDGVAEETCRDVLVEAPTCLPLGQKALPSPPSALRPFAAAAAVPSIPGRAESRPDAAARAATHELTLSTVLRV
ncbi:MAG TPA: hypothetical protein VE129_16905 [Thermoanaerobaculia bacterium]|nr:hypothetical protein [Thermoanaerobaculia bacterium]